MLRRRFRRIGVNEASRSPFEAGHLRQARNNFDMPVIVVVCWHVKGLRMEKVIVGRLPAGTFDTTDNVTRKPRSFAKLSGLRIFKPRPVLTGGKPHFVAEATGIRTEGDEVVGLRHDSLTGSDFALDHVGEQRLFVLMKVLAAGRQLVLDDFWYRRERNKLAMHVLQRRAGCRADILK